MHRPEAFNVRIGPVNFDQPGIGPLDITLSGPAWIEFQDTPRIVKYVIHEWNWEEARGRKARLSLDTNWGDLQAPS